MRSIKAKECRKLFGLMMFLAVLFVLESDAFAIISIGCGWTGANIPGGGAELRSKGESKIGLNYSYKHADRLVRESQNEANDIDVKNLWTSLTLSYEYGVTDQLTIISELPHSVNVRRQGYNAANPEYHSSGIGDFVLSGRCWLSSPSPNKWNFFGELGLRSPTGEDEERDIEGNYKKVYIQPGLGQWGLIPSFGFYKEVGGLSFTGSIGCTLNLNKNDAGYESANAIHASIGGARNFLVFGKEDKYQFTASLFFLGVWIGDKDKRDGVEVSNTGGTWYYANPGISFTPNSGKFSFYLSTPISLSRDVNSLQTYEKISYNFGIEFRF